MSHSTFPRSGVLVLASTSIQSLLPATLISQAESLLESHRINDAIDLAAQQSKKLQGKIPVDEDEADELRYVYQRIGFQCFTETLFEDAGRNLLAGELDPRLLIGYFPELRGSLFSPDDVSDVFSGVAEHMPYEASVDDIIVANLVRNYSPHLSPNTRAAPPTAELRKILGIAAKDMLEAFLRKRRAKRRATGSGSGATSKGKEKAADEVVDTVLAKLFALSEKTKDLYALLQEPNDIVSSEIEAVLQETGQYNALCMLYRQRGDDVKLLDVWAKLAEGQWTDDDIRDPLSNMFNLLSGKRDRPLLQHWGIWFTKRDPERGLKLLITRDSNKRREKPEEDLAMLQRIQEANPTAAAQFLEHLVLQKRSTDPSLHMQLAMTCVDQLLACLMDESVSKLWRAKASSYASARTDSSFLSYIASTTPNSEHKRARLKTLLFLQGSTRYDPKAIRERLLEQSHILKLELAIIYGKLGDHRSALAILVRDLRDSTSAEAYCTLGGDVIPGKTAQAVGEKCSLQQWASTLLTSPTAITKSESSKTVPIAGQKSVDEAVKKNLLKILLEVYMTDEESSMNRAAHLLNSQAMNLDVLDVISLVPPSWPLHEMSSFLARSFRRTLHARHEGQIKKSISAGQNMEVADRTWVVLREHGAIIEETGDVDDDDGEVYDEKLLEKVALRLDKTDSHEVTEIPLGDQDTRKQESNWLVDTDAVDPRG